MWSYFRWVLLVLAILLAVMLGRTLMMPAGHSSSSEAVSVPFDEARIVRVMSESIQFQTVSTGDYATQDMRPFADFMAWLAREYASVYAALSVEVIADYTLLFTWQGRDASLAPILLTAHYDVVPVVPGSEVDWVHPPFAGVIDDGYVWGRGALDDKSAMISMLEAARQLLDEGFQPQRTVYFR